MKKIITISLLISVLGCEPRKEDSKTFVDDDCQFKVAILLDLSGSFEHLMCEGGKAYQFALNVLDHYFRERLGTDDKLIIAQISGADRSLLWEGTPLQLRQNFPSAKAFGEFLRIKSDPSESHIHDSIIHSLEYITSDPAIMNGQAKSAVFILSDMLDNGSSQDSKKQAIEALSTYAEKGGVVGMYYVDQFLVSEWRKELQNAGVKELCVESEIVGVPRLPNFD